MCYERLGENECKQAQDKDKEERMSSVRGDSNPRRYLSYMAFITSTNVGGKQNAWRSWTPKGQVQCERKVQTVAPLKPLPLNKHVARTITDTPQTETHTSKSNTHKRVCGLINRAYVASAAPHLALVCLFGRKNKALPNSRPENTFNYSYFPNISYNALAACWKRAFFILGRTMLLSNNVRLIKLAIVAFLEYFCKNSKRA